jgi:hypothetical protein
MQYFQLGMHGYFTPHPPSGRPLKELPTKNSDVASGQFITRGKMWNLTFTLYTLC